MYQFWYGFGAQSQAQQFAAACSDAHSRVHCSHSNMIHRLQPDRMQIMPTVLIDSKSKHTRLRVLPAKVAEPIAAVVDSWCLYPPLRLIRARNCPGRLDTQMVKMAGHEDRCCGHCTGSVGLLRPPLRYPVRVPHLMPMHQTDDLAAYFESNRFVPHVRDNKTHVIVFSG